MSATIDSGTLDAAYSGLAARRAAAYKRRLQEAKKAQQAQLEAQQVAQLTESQQQDSNSYSSKTGESTSSQNSYDYDDYLYQNVGDVSSSLKPAVEMTSELAEETGVVTRRHQHRPAVDLTSELAEETGVATRRQHRPSADLGSDLEDETGLAMRRRRIMALRRQQMRRRNGLENEEEQSLGMSHNDGGYGGGGPVYIESNEHSVCGSGLNQILAFAVLALAAAAAYFIYTKITNTGGGRRRSLAEVDSLKELAQMVYIGLEEFEDKIDKIAGGADEGESSWIGQLYKKFKGSFLDGAGTDDNSVDNMDGLEPPILDERWGLENVRELFDANNSTLANHNSTMTNSTTTLVSRTKRSASNLDYGEDQTSSTHVASNDNEDDDEYVKSLKGESKCRTKFWRCIAKVVKGSSHYLDAPGGISGAFQKTMFRMAFHGGFGNVWNALMTIPEARDVKRCMNSQDECMNFEVLRAEVSGDNESNRLIVNPDFVEGQDTSDGKTQWNPEDMDNIYNNILA